MRPAVDIGSFQGPTECGRVADHQGSLQLLHSLFILPMGPRKLLRNRQPALLIGEIDLLHYLKPPRQGREVPPHVPVFRSCLTNVVDENAFVIACGIGEKRDRRAYEGAGCNVDWNTLRGLPDGMELRFDESPRHLPKRPAYELFSAEQSHLLWHDTETFVAWLIDQWPALDDEWTRWSGNGGAKLKDMLSGNVRDGEP